MKLLAVAVLLATAVLQAADADDPGWSPANARTYLDERAAWWIGWKSAARDQETFCISCHTALPYALGRPALRSSTGEQGASPNEQKILDNIVKRVYASARASTKSCGLSDLRNHMSSC